MHFLLHFVAYSVYDGPKYVGCMQKKYRIGYNSRTWGSLV